MSISSTSDSCWSIGGIVLGSLLFLTSAIPAQSPLRFGTSQPIDGEPKGIFFTLPISVDLDGDGDQDWLYTVGNYYAVRWLENQGGSPPLYVKREITSYGSVIPIGRTPVVADFDNDGDLDVVVSGMRASDSVLAELSWLDQPEDPVNGLWKKRVIQIGEDSGFCLAANLDGNDRPDILSITNTMKYMLASATGAVEFGAPSLLPFDVGHRVESADFDGDGLVDLVAAWRGILYGIEIEPGTPPVFTRTDLRLPESATSFVAAFDAGDLSGDGKPDLAYIDQSIAEGVGHNDLYIKVNEHPGGSFGAEQHLAEFPPGIFPIRSVRILDVDLDGRNDLLIQQYNSRIYVMPNAGGADPFTRVIIPETPSLANFDDFGLIDFDRDGDLDLAGDGPLLRWFPNESSAYIRGVRLHQDLDEGAFTPGETGNLLVNLGNFAAHPVADVSIDLSSSSPEFIPVISSSNLGTINKGGSRDLSVPFQISAGAVCSTTLDVVLDVKVAGITVDHYVIPVLVGRVTEVETITDVDEAPNAAISDPVIVPPSVDPAPVPLLRTLTLSSPPGPIISVVLDLNITHSYRGDLVVQLRSPEDTIRTIFEGTVNDSGTSITGPFTVTGLDGEQATGEYELVVTDRVQGDTGTLVSWGLTVTSLVQDCGLPVALPGAAESLLAIAEPQPSDDVNEDGVIDCADLIATN